jgi:peptide/nickel transport system permease protein
VSTAPTTIASGSPRSRAARRPRRTTLTAGLAILGALVLLALLAPLFADPYATPFDGLSMEGLPLPVLSDGHLLGTDALGRDMLSRTAHGARTSLEITLFANVLSVGLGAIVGVLAGFHRGWVEHVLMRITDVFLSIPTVLSGLALASIVGTGVFGIVVVVTALYWAWTARLVFGETLRVRRRAFVEAAIAQGVPSRTVIRRHVLPHLASLLLVVAALNAAAVISIGTGLSYLGAGIQPPEPEWGNMLAEGALALDYAPHLLLIPLACVVLAVFSFVLIAEALARRGDVRLRRSWLDI